MKKLLFYFAEPFQESLGGVERISCFLGDYFESKGYQVFYLSDNVKKDQSEKNNVFFPKGGGLQNLDNQKFLKMFLIDNEIDVIINQSGIFPSSLPLIDIKGKANLITVMHNSLFGMFSYPNLGIHGPIVEKILYNFLAKKLYRFLFYIKYHSFYKQIVTNSDKICLISEKFRKEIKFYSGLDSQNICVIPNCLTLPFNENLCNSKKNEVLFVGRLEWQKRPDLMLKIWKRVEVLSKDWTLRIIGDGKMRKSLECYARANKIRNVVFEGKKDSKFFYKNAKILCMTSCYESFGLVLLEAMHFGVVPIAFNSFPNLPDIISNGKDGFFVNYPQIKEYSKVLYALMTLNDMSGIIGNMHQKVVNYSVEKIGNQWEKIFNEIER